MKRNIDAVEVVYATEQWVDGCSMVTIEEATNWVLVNKRMIVDRAKEYSRYAPYDIDDYIQDAYHAAVEAALSCQKNPKLEFEGVFRVVFRRLVAKVTPLPEEARAEAKKKKAAAHGNHTEDSDNAAVKGKTYHSGGTSMSFPCAAQSYQSLEKFKAVSGKSSKIDISAFIEDLKPLWSARECTAMEYALGLTRDGYLSIPDIAKKMGVGKYTAREYVERAIKKVEQMVKLKESGKLVIISERRREKESNPQEIFSSVKEG